MDDLEEPDLPQILTPEGLRIWNKERNEAGSQQEHSNVHADTTSFLMSAQHQLALDPQVKRCRHHRERTPELWPDINPNLPTHLKELQIFHRDSLRPATTTVKCTLPNIEVMKQELLIEAGMKKKAWKHGLVLTADHKPAKALDSNEKGQELIRDILEQWTR